MLSERMLSTIVREVSRSYLKLTPTTAMVLLSRVSSREAWEIISTLLRPTGEPTEKPSLATAVAAGAASGLAEEGAAFCLFLAAEAGASFRSGTAAGAFCTPSAASDLQVWSQTIRWDWAERVRPEKRARSGRSSCLVISVDLFYL